MAGINGKKGIMFQIASACYLSEWLDIYIMMHHTAQGFYVLEHDCSVIEAYFIVFIITNLQLIVSKTVQTVWNVNCNLVN